jgi:nicotinamidase-related amidase
MAIWDDVLTDLDKKIYHKANFGREASLGKRPALAIIDVTYDFVGDKPEPILQSIERFPLSCGENGWKAVKQIASLLPLAREKQLPIIYTASNPALPRVWQKRHPGEKQAKNKIDNEIVEEIAPSADDIVLHKIGPSIFQGTPLVNILVHFRIDTLLCCGTTTSGCVRASVVDASTYGFDVGIIEECTFDRGEVSHKINLFDMDAKYGKVMSLAETRDYLNKL